MVSKSSILDRLSELDTNTVSDALDFLGLKGATYGLRPLWDCPKIVGRASAVKVGPKTDAAPTAHLLTPVIDAVTTDDRILVIFGLYGERVGALHLVVPRHLSPQGALSELVSLARAEYPNPPRFGASIVETVLADEKLRAQWEKDLGTMSSGIKAMRRKLRTRLEENRTPGDWPHLESQIGMFSYTGLNGEMVARLQKEFHVYLLPSGRASICGLNENNVKYVARAIGKLLGQVEVDIPTGIAPR